MCKCIKLNKNNITQLKLLNDSRIYFNKLNEDFFALYRSCNIFQKMFLKRDITLLISEGKYIGYIWATMQDKNSYLINSLNIDSTSNVEKYISLLIGTLRVGYTASYTCEGNGNNVNQLEKAGFRKISGTIKMELNLSGSYTSSINNEVMFKILEKGKEEKIRCNIQNEVFKNDTRIPISIRDIYFDQCQEYYFDDGAIFIMKDNKYMGYGQIIIENNVPIIVNLGILKDYRGKGYGKALINYLLQIVRINKFEKVIINVDWNNKIALEMYKKCGFKIVSEQYNMKAII
ncbi:putative acetyltransferase [Clostridium liquoris]|uniref:Putative acetyltransferase n=1 Tax=Clostridium liquoris TaxID=1289519 RepID=A0A2T0B4Z7_9CLOT|nr:GNAT family N-acetyltransferase [Clostridium liquoris]PRR78883.1 putative acetyltransferase [Clostridium liquoris]